MIISENEKMNDEVISDTKQILHTKSEPELNPEQTRCLEEVLNGRNTLVTGPAGVGKSLLCNQICSIFDKLGKVYRIVAPTGIAAVNVGGQTVHRFLGMRPDVKDINDYRKLCKRKSRVPWRSLDAIMIDEVSMLHPDLFVLFDQIAREHRGIQDKPFGGIQMILVGDFYQLCPIRSKSYKVGDADYIFETPLFRKLDLHLSMLCQVMRQNNDNFIKALNDLRLGLLTPLVISMITECSANKRKRDKHYVRLFALNIDKNQANEKQLMKLTTADRSYKAVDIGNEIYLKDCRAEKVIQLKIGCPVMLLWNLPEYELCNGSVGILEKFDTSGLPIVKFNNGQEVVIKRETWTIMERTKTDSRVLASRTQIPLAVAWALSIHKSQGLTIDHLVVDCTGIFTTGQLYVALSRAKTFENLIIRNFQPKTIMVDKKVSNFFDDVVRNIA